MEVTSLTLLIFSEYYKLRDPPDISGSCSIIMNSQDGSSEAFIGEWAEQRDIRDRLFIATKVILMSLYDVDNTDNFYALVYIQHQWTQ
jgi:hypothetical protein